ncbi:hypothetical protein [Prosthecomicrobium sp. N25]|uniref:hypothetical protein n=1 Tax=Prosthecomicrobium sp. N25 TaxID=3129254 RepID=UPI003076E9F6
MIRGFVLAAAAAAALSLGSAGSAAAGTVGLDEVQGLSKDFGHTYQAGAKIYVAPAYRVYRPRVVVRPYYYPVVPVYKVKRPKVYVY